MGRPPAASGKCIQLQARLLAPDTPVEGAAALACLCMDALLPATLGRMQQHMLCMMGMCLLSARAC